MFWRMAQRSLHAPNAPSSKNPLTRYGIWIFADAKTKAIPILPPCAWTKIRTIKLSLFKGLPTLTKKCPLDIFSIPGSSSLLAYPGSFHELFVSCVMHGILSFFVVDECKKFFFWRKIDFEMRVIVQKLIQL